MKRFLFCDLRGPKKEGVVTSLNGIKYLIFVTERECLLLGTNLFVHKTYVNFCL